VVAPCSDRISRVPPYSRTDKRLTRTGLSPILAALSNAFRFSLLSRWPGPVSLATTPGVSVDVLSCGYLDVSVPRVRFFLPIVFRRRYLVRDAWKKFRFRSRAISHPLRDAGPARTRGISRDGRSALRMLTHPFAQQLKQNIFTST
jgi:hypothetical protein